MRMVRPAYIDDAVLVSSTVEDTVAAWSGDETYAAGAVRYRAIEGVHFQFRSLQAGNTDKVPENEPEWWRPEGPTPAWAMFDGGIQTKSSAPDLLGVGLQLPVDQRADTLALLNIDAASVQVVVTDDVDGVVYDRTFGLISDSGITDIYAYFFEPIVRLPDLILTDLPAGYAGSLVEVSLIDEGGQPSCGALVIGHARKLGDTRWNPSLGIRDFSTKGDAPWGEFVIVEKAYRRRASFSVIVPMGFVDELMDLLPQYRAKPVLWIGDSEFRSTAIFGYFKDFNVELSLPPSLALCSLDLESLV
ncbi:hypothetical protein LRS10_13845 [Phenylobacterium sp. J426]|uniref:hypothetical protein n=1 Tax=Phenylobacterium sp. J426 TaxID=2898439 RepID=UPI002150BE09|nr:hypothetical protein [Phenylobacterium sp. J426]MCR5875176.1 hypothetical protein [Phenylobacterium sp. J426]